MGTKRNPGTFDCYANAHPEEPMFVLLGRDPASPLAVVKWTHERVRLGKNKRGDEQIAEAVACAAAMREYADNKYPPHKTRREIEFTGALLNIIDTKRFDRFGDELSGDIAALMADGLKYRKLMNW